uniref:Uncharacterized protein n=1 Tax=Anguilla anguilla TaxID=7936 RepID=A0A0E9SXV0_ANGAN
MNIPTGSLPTAWPSDIPQYGNV